MKKLLTLILISISLSLNAIEYPNLKPLPNIIDGKRIPNVKPIMGDYLYIGETEVSNWQYKAFLNWLKKHRPEDYKANLPDTNRWRLKYAYNEPFVQYYFQHPAYQNFPLVNISQRQAANYCEWLHDSLTHYFANKKIKIGQFIVRLPTEKEWMLAARGGLPESSVYPWEGDGIRKINGREKHKGYAQLNCKHGYINYNYAGSLFDKNAFITTDVKSYWPNGFGLYNMSGNVAEWIAEQGRSKGGSWALPAYNARIDMPGYYDGDSSAHPDIGFRYVIEIISAKNEYKPIVFNAKYFKNHFMYIPSLDMVSGNYIFAGDCEVTNGEYRTFLAEDNTPDYSIATERWGSYFKYEYYQMYGWHSAFNDFPVVNITHNAAIKYCEWLTQKYNSMDKRKYKKVVFRLPDEREWEAIAKGGNNYMYPWGGPYTRNSRGCYLANFCPLEDQYLFKTDSGFVYKYPNNDFRVSRSIDGSIIPARVNSYFPNNYGIYNSSGNVAEMISEYGITKGGSWNSNDYYIRINSKEAYTHPDPTIGFRVIMEVLEK